MFQFTQSESNSVRRRIFFYAVDATDGFTAVTTGLGASTSVSIVKNGVTPATVPISPSFTHISNGLWYYEMIAGHLDTVGVLTLTISDALIRTLQLIGYVYSGDPLSAIPAFPTNFSSLAITAGGTVTAGTVSDKTGYSLTQTFPTNFSSLAITAGGTVTVGTNNDKTAYSLSGTQTFNVTGNITGNLSGTVGSVTGAVGSVTGAVGSVTGSVGSVTGAVGSVTGAVGSVTGAVGSVTGAVGSVTAAVTVGTINASVITATSIATDAITAAKIATDAIDADALATDAVAEIADGLLNRNVGGGSNAGRLVKEALYALRNKSEIIGATLSVYDALDALSWTAVVASSSSADPVTGIDP
jgi:hypothetical protein